MLFHSTLICASILLLGSSISGLPSTSYINSRSEAIEKLSVEPSQGDSVRLKSDRSISDLNSLSSPKIRSVLNKRVRGSQLKTGCDGTFYKQSRIESTIATACKQSTGAGKGTLKGAFTGMFRAGPERYTGPLSLFPGETDLTMRRITANLGALTKSLFRSGKADYVVFSGRCEQKGIVRKSRDGTFSLCTKSTGVF